MKSVKLHKIIGIILILPFIGWTITGFIFFIKPGYDEAYEMLIIKEYPVVDTIIIVPQENWKNIRVKKTILGTHVLANIDGKESNLNPYTLIPNPGPSKEDIRKLLEDSFSTNPNRYGKIVEFNEGYVLTETGVKVTYNWNSLSLYQTGDDTDLIDRIYKIHYLQWTGIDWIDDILGMIGLFLVLILTFLGVRLAFKV